MRECCPLTCEKEAEYQKSKSNTTSETGTKAEDVDNYSCLSERPGWAGYTCSSGYTYCRNTDVYGKDMKECCP